jgi:hypothetical protein
MLSGPLVLRLLPLGLPALSKTYADELLEMVWRAIAPS